MLFLGQSDNPTIRQSDNPTVVSWKLIGGRGENLLHPGNQVLVPVDIGGVLGVVLVGLAGMGDV